VRPEPSEITEASRPRSPTSKATTLFDGGVPMRGRSPHSYVAVAAIAVTALVIAAAPPGQAANPEVNHFEFAFGFTWSDFCSTGVDVEVSGSYRGTEFLEPNQPVDERVKLEGKTVYVNSVNGRMVTLHLADTTWSTT